MSHYETKPKKCRVEDCEETFVPHHWGTKAAERLGWFMQKNGDAWCPNHTPEWVAEWRSRKTRGE